MMENFDIIWTLVSAFIPLLFVTVFVVIIVNVVKSISASHKFQQTVGQTISSAVDRLQTVGLNDRGNYLIPRIAADYPGFSPAVALGCAKEAVRMKFGSDAVSVGNAVISDYTRSAEKGTVVMEVAASLRQSGVRRCIVTYENKTDQSTNCPHCGAPLRDSRGNVCEYCGSPIELTSEGWKVTAVMAG